MPNPTFEQICPVDDEFAETFEDALLSGARIAKRSSVCFVGLARQLGDITSVTCERIEATAKHFNTQCAYIFENDSTDETKEKLAAWKPPFPAHVESRNLAREHLPLLRDDKRTTPLAEYRQRCVEFVASLHPLPDYVIAMDMDLWGGWRNAGILTGIHYLESIPNAACMASVSMAQIPHFNDQWIHYDAWAHRPHWSWRQRPEMWFHHYLPPVGAPPIRVNSAFGGLAIYKTSAYITGVYSGIHLGLGDCEHVSFHRSMQGDTYLNPSQRTIVFWSEPKDEAEGVVEK